MASPELWQRVYAIKDKKHFRRSIIMSSLFYIIVGFILLLIGLVIRADIPDIAPDTSLIVGFSRLLPVGLAGLSVVIIYSSVSSSADTQVPTGIQVGHGVRPAATQKMFTQGEFNHTQNQLDMANIEPRVALQDGLPPVRMNANQIQQVFINLMKNAVEAMSEGGKVSFETRYRDVLARNPQLVDVSEELRAQIRRQLLDAVRYQTGRQGNRCVLRAADQVPAFRQGYAYVSLYD